MAPPTPPRHVAPESAADIASWIPGTVRIIAIDWSGAKSRPQSKIWLAEVREGELVRLESGRDRQKVIGHLIDESRSDPDMIVGLDFAFSLPEWFVVDRCGATSIEELWRVVADRGEDWLDRCEPPFWGRPERSRPDLHRHFRRTEELASEPAGSQPKSVFQIGGAGAVGTGSIRGMPHLLSLREAGFSIWPFHESSTPLVVEIYPRLLTGKVTKSDHASRETYLREGFPEIPSRLARVASASDDAFDAAISSVVMARHMDDLRALTRSTDPTVLLEGRIWWPTEARGPIATAAGRVHEGCPFCEMVGDSIVRESRHGFAVRDRYPISPGHTLVVPRRHVVSLFDLPPATQADLWALVEATRSDLLEEHGSQEHGPDGFNIGINDGVAAGQTVDHAHIHVIPRRDRDVEDPRGGIRWVIPDRAAYWDQ